MIVTSLLGALVSVVIDDESMTARIVGVTRNELPQWALLLQLPDGRLFPTGVDGSSVIKVVAS